MSSRIASAAWLAGVLAALGVAGCSTGGADRAPAGGRGGRMSQAIPVAAVEVRPRDLAKTVTVAAPIEPIRTVSVNALTAGTVLSVLVEEGSRVRPGQAMAELDARETTAQLERAQAVFTNAGAAFHRAERLREDSLNSAAELDAARSAYAIAKAEVEIWKARLAFTRIAAPVQGVVTAKRVERGDAVTANQSVFEIADDSELAVRVQVSELDVVHLEAGREVTLRLDAYPGRPIAGRIRRIFPSADATSRLVPVEVVLAPIASGVRARPGFLARVELALDRRSGVLAVPTSAVGTSDHGAYVYVIDADTLIRRPVETGLTTAGWIEVTSGLEAGERVVNSGHMNLRPGAPVDVSEGAAAGDATR